MAFYTYIYAPKQTQLSWVWDLLVITNSTQISRKMKSQAWVLAWDLLVITTPYKLLYPAVLGYHCYVEDFVREQNPPES